jgi:hypothetical protein
MSDINVLSGGAPKEALAVLTPQFEAKAGHRVHYTYAVISEMQKKLAAGETPDLVFMPVPAIDALVKARAFQECASGRARGRPRQSHGDAERGAPRQADARAWNRARTARQGDLQQRPRWRRSAHHQW